MFSFRMLAIVTGVVLTVAVSPAQQTGGTGPGPTGGTGGAPAGPTTGPGSTNPSPGLGVPNNNSNRTGGQNSPFPEETTRPIFLSGRVIMGDGTALSGPVVIERVCGGIPHPEAYTDPKGRFSFQLGQSREVFMDLSESNSTSLTPSTSRSNPDGGIRTSDLATCEIRASLAGYRSTAVSLFNHRYLDNPELGTLILQRQGNVEGLTVSATTARASKDARKAYEKGLEAAKKNKQDEAQKQFQKAVELYPQYAAAWLELGKADESLNQVEEARKAYAQALAADSRYINPYEQLYMLAFKERKWQEVADTTDRVLRLNPYDFPGAYYFNGVANLELNRLDQAEKSAREAVKLDTTHRNPKAGYVLGLVLARKRDFAESGEYLRGYLKAVPNAPDAEIVRKQLSRVDELAQAGAQPQN